MVEVWLLNFGDGGGLVTKHVCQKISASVDEGLSVGYSVRRPGSEDPHRLQRKFTQQHWISFLTVMISFQIIKSVCGCLCS